MEAQGEIKAVAEIRRLADASEKGLTDKVTILEIIDPAKDDRNPPENLVPVIAQEVEGVVVRRDDQVETGLGVLMFQDLPQLLKIETVIHPFRAHVFYMDSGFSACGLQRGNNAPGNVVSPFESLMVRVEDKDVFVRCGPRIREEKKCPRYTKQQAT